MNDSTIMYLDSTPHRKLFTFQAIIKPPFFCPWCCSLHFALNISNSDLCNSPLTAANLAFFHSLLLLGCKDSWSSWCYSSAHILQGSSWLWPGNLDSWLGLSTCLFHFVSHPPLGSIYPISHPCSDSLSEHIMPVPSSCGQKTSPVLGRTLVCLWSLTDLGLNTSSATS